MPSQVPRRDDREAPSGSDPDPDPRDGWSSPTATTRIFVECGIVDGLRRASPTARPRSLVHEKQSARGATASRGSAWSSRRGDACGRAHARAHRGAAQSIDALDRPDRLQSVCSSEYSQRHVFFFMYLPLGTGRVRTRPSTRNRAGSAALLAKHRESNHGLVTLSGPLRAGVAAGAGDMQEEVRRARAHVAGDSALDAVPGCCLMFFTFRPWGTLKVWIDPVGRGIVSASVGLERRPE